MAQFSRYADELQLKGLDIHPRPSLLRERGLLLYGAIDLGVVTAPGPEPLGRCDKLQASRLASITPSLLGLRATEVLQDGWRASVNLEHGLSAASGLPSNDCGPFFDRAAVLGLAHRRWGRLEFGRQEHPAYNVALRGDPWSGNGPASPGDTRYYARPVDASGSAPAGSAFRVRAPRAITYTSPEEHDLWVKVQASLTPTSQGEPDPLTAADEREYGVALHWHGAAIHLALGYQRWNERTWAAPISVSWRLQRWTAQASWSWGHRADGVWRNLLLGATLADDSGARPGLTRLGLSLHQDGQGRSSGKLGAGRVWPLSRYTQIEADAGLEWPRAEARRPLRAGVALQHRFSL